MAIRLQTTRDIAVQGVKLLVYGAAGAGKTSLVRTLPKPIVLSAEGGLLSLADEDIPFIEISSVSDLQDAYSWLTGEEGSEYQSICLDSISEIAEVVLNYEKKHAKDPRQAYGAMQEQITDLIRAFRDIQGKHVYLFVCRCQEV